MIDFIIGLGLGLIIAAIVYKRVKRKLGKCILAKKELQNKTIEL